MQQIQFSQRNFPDDPNEAPAGSAAHSDSLFPIGVVRPAVNRLFAKSRMREIRTYGSVVGPPRRRGGLPDLRLETPADEPWLAGIYAASVTGRIATGPQAGRRVVTGNKMLLGG